MPARMKLARWGHPRRPIASELTGKRCQSYPARVAPIAVKGAREQRPGYDSAFDLSTTLAPRTFACRHGAKATSPRCRSTCPSSSPPKSRSQHRDALLD